MVMQEESEFEASLGYIVSSRQPLWASRILSLKKEKKKFKYSKQYLLALRDVSM